MQVLDLSACRDSETESEDVSRFEKSLQELKDLRSQLHHAADYCETTFFNTEEKRHVIDNTKEYLCRALVAVVDHLGCVSANLNCSISKANAFSEAELRINCLKQRLLSCEKYAHKLALTRATWNVNLPKLHQRYLSTSITSVGKSNEDERELNSPASVKFIDKHGINTEDLPLFLYTYTQKPHSTKKSSTGTSTEKEQANSALVPVHDGISILSRSPNPIFHFQQSTQKRGRNSIFRRSIHNNDILSLIRRRTKGLV